MKCLINAKCDAFATWPPAQQQLLLLSTSNEFIKATKELQARNGCWLLLDQTSF